MRSLGLPIVSTCLLLVVRSAWGATSNEQRFEQASAALAAGNLDTAVIAFEALADTGFIHPDASFNRGLAYSLRASGRDEQPGDLGRAAASFEEAHLLRPTDPEIERALDATRAEVTRRRARRAKDDIIVRPSLDRAVVQLLPPGAWFVVASVASGMFALGLVLFFAVKRGALHVAGSVIAPTFGVLLVLLAPLAYFSRWLADNRRPGVIVSAEITLVDAASKPVPGRPIPEGASVEVGERAGDRLFVRWGSQEGYASAAAVRVLARPR